MDSSKIKVIIIAVLAAFFALYLGVAAATAQFEAIAWVAGIGCIVLLIALGKHVWCLIPIGLAFAGQVNAVPGSPSPWWLATIAVALMFTIRFLSRKHDFQFRFTWLEFAILLQVIAVAQAFIRNPAGLSILGGDTVGGKPYISFAMATVAYLMLSVVNTELKIVKIVIMFVIGASFLDGGLLLASVYAPALAAAVLPIYSGVSFTAAVSGTTVVDTESYRLDGAQVIGSQMGIATLTLFRPLTTINPFYPLRFLMIVSCLSLVLLSGFRSVLGVLVIYGVVSYLIRKKMADVLIGAMIAFIGLTVLVVSDSAQKLPFGAQRILYVLPINVSDQARQDAEQSSDWRFEMWRLALTTDRYINNKLLGDGFNFRRDELAAQLAISFGDTRMASNVDSIDNFMSKGSYHGFHVEAIRMTGALGLLCAVIALIIFLKYAWRQIKHFRGRPEWGFVLFICIPFLIHPFYLLLIFGAYRTGFPDILVAAGMIKVLDNIRVRELAAIRSEIRSADTALKEGKSLNLAAAKTAW